MANPMQQPITWRNIDAPNLSGAGSMFAQSNAMIQDALGSLRGSLKAYEETDKANWNQGKINNSNALLARIAAIQDPAQAQAEAQKIIAEAQDYGAQVDMASILKAAQSRPGEVMNAWTQQENFKQAALSREQAPLVASLMGRLASDSGNVGVEAQELFNSGNLNPVDFRSIMDGVSKYDDKAFARNNAAAEMGLKQLVAQRQMAAADAQIEASKRRVASGPKLNLSDMARAMTPSKEGYQVRMDAFDSQIKAAQEKLKELGKGADNSVSVNDKDARKQVQKFLEDKSVGVNALDVGVNPANFLDTFLRKARSKGAIDENNNLLIPLPMKDGDAEVKYAKRPLTVETVLRAISASNGVTDPTSRDAAAQLFDLVRKPSFLSDEELVDKVRADITNLQSQQANTRLQYVQGVDAAQRLMQQLTLRGGLGGGDSGKAED